MTNSGTESSPVREVRLAVDVGGTFTDVVLLLPDGTAIPQKLLSSPPHFDVAVRAGIGAILNENGLLGQAVREYAHGTTVATNCILTRGGARTGLITTSGFRDVLEIRRMRMHRLYDIHWAKPPPLVPRHLRLEVPARTDPRSGIETPLDEDAVRAVLGRLVAEGVESLAVCYLHAYAGGANERRTRDIARQVAPGLSISISSEVLPEIKEYERTSTTVINAYIQPAIARYAEAMERDLKSFGVGAPAMVMQSNGGMMPLALARSLPIHIVESGPAAGVTAAHRLAQRLGIGDVLSLDMGGTTAKAAIIEDGQISRSPEYEVGGDISIGHRLMKGGGYLLRVPSIDIAEVGAGGGSVAWHDAGGALKVGPHSAAAAPGPACYDRGGLEPTITDANVYLGLTNPHALAGGSLKIQPDLAENAIHERIAAPLGLGTTEAAWAIRSVAQSSLARALRAVSAERGRDPRRFVLFAFGGMGPVHALDVAAELGIVKAVIPPLPGLFSALGLLFAEVEHHLIRTYYADPMRPDLGRLNALANALSAEAAAMLAEEGYDAAHRDIKLSADMRYVGQDHPLTVALPGNGFDAAMLGPVAEGFHREHERLYGYRSDGERVQIMALRCLGRGISERTRVPDQLKTRSMAGWSPSRARRCYFGPARGWIETDVIGRADLAGRRVKGPTIIEEDNSLTVLLPGWSASADEWSNIVLEPNP
jgi:N-methylhydantoinase A